MGASRALYLYTFLCFFPLTNGLRKRAIDLLAVDFLLRFLAGHGISGCFTMGLNKGVGMVMTYDGIWGCNGMSGSRVRFCLGFFFSIICYVFPVSCL